MEDKELKRFYCFMNKLKFGLHSEVITNYIPIYMTMKDENDYEPIHVACENGFVKLINFFITKSVDLESKSRYGWRPIHHACFSGNVELVKLLISHNCNIEASDKNYWRPIHWACRLGHFDIAFLFLQQNCDIDAPGLDDLRPIHVACRYGHEEIVRLLISYKCNLETFDKRKWQPMHLACYKGNIEIVKILIKADCHLEICDKNNQSPCDIAKKYGHCELFGILQNEIINKVTKNIISILDLKCNSECNHEFCSESIRSNDFKKGDVIGKGCFGKVYKYNIPELERKVVVKRILHDSKESLLIEQNINKYRLIINHEKIVQYYGALVKCGKLCIYMEYMPGGTLKEYISKEKPLCHNLSTLICQQILEGVDFLHGLKIIHRDIKTVNILLDQEKNIKLSDFGLSRSLESISCSSKIHSATSFCGTVNYMAPEVMKNESYSFKADIWSVGAVMTEMLSGKVPFCNMGFYAIIESFRSGTIIYKPEKPISRQLKSFVKEMLQINPLHRSNAKTLLKNEVFLKNK